MLSAVVGTIQVLYGVRVLVVVDSCPYFAASWTSTVLGRMSISMALETLNWWSKVLFDGVTCKAKKDALWNRVVRAKHERNFARWSCFDGSLFIAKIGHL